MEVDNVADMVAWAHRILQAGVVCMCVCVCVCVGGGVLVYYSGCEISHH